MKGVFGVLVFFGCVLIIPASVRAVAEEEKQEAPAVQGKEASPVEVQPAAPAGAGAEKVGDVSEFKLTAPPVELEQAGPAKTFEVEAPARFESETYIVKKGDSLWLIARDHKVTVQDLCKANGISVRDRLVPGQKLIIGGPGGSEGIAAPGEAGPARRSAGASGAAITYTVKHGDSLWSIAHRHGVTMREVCKVNGLKSYKEAVKAGQKLVIPSRAASPKAQREVEIPKPAEETPGPIEQGTQPGSEGM